MYILLSITLKSLVYAPVSEALCNTVRHVPMALPLTRKYGKLKAVSREI